MFCVFKGKGCKYDDTCTKTIKGALDCGYFHYFTFLIENYSEDKVWDLPKKIIKNTIEKQKK
jgi:hypothetical protein